MTAIHTEKQRPITDILIVVILLIIGNGGLLLYSFFTILILVPFDVMVVFLICSMCLKIKVTEYAILFKFFPYHISWREINFNNCSEVSIIEYDAISDFQGIGRRHLIYKNEKAYITEYSGYALRLKCKDHVIYTLGVKNYQKIRKILSEGDTLEMLEDVLSPCSKVDRTENTIDH